MNSVQNIDAGYQLTNNFSRLLVDLAKDFEGKTLLKCHQRGHTRIRSSHTSLFSHLGFGQARLTELAERAGITQQAMGKLVKEMERVGYVKREVDAMDKRAKIIELTDLGNQLLRDKIEIVDEVIDEYTDALGEEGFKQLEHVLEVAIRSIGLIKQPSHLREVSSKTAQ